LTALLLIEICKDGRPPVSFRVGRIVDLQVLDGDLRRHITGIPEIVLSGVVAADQTYVTRLQPSWHETAVADEKLALPRTSVIGTQIDQVCPVDGGILKGKG